MGLKIQKIWQSVTAKFSNMLRNQLVQRTVALIPWRSNLTLLDKLEDPKTTKE